MSADYIANNLQAIRKSLLDVVLPAVDRSDPLAVEQLNLVVDYLSFLEDRIDWLNDFGRTELAVAVDLARQVCALPISREDSDAVRSLLSEVDELDLSQARPSQLRVMSSRLTSAIDNVVEQSTHYPDELKQTLHRLVMTKSENVLEMDLSWYAPISVEPEGPGVFPLEQAFGRIAARSEAS